MGIIGGEGPLQIEVIRAQVRLSTTLGSLRIQAIDHEGVASSSWCCQADPEGWISFMIGDKRPTSTMYFLN